MEISINIAIVLPTYTTSFVTTYTGSHPKHELHWGCTSLQALAIAQYKAAFFQGIAHTTCVWRGQIDIEVVICIVHVACIWSNKNCTTTCACSKTSSHTFSMSNSACNQTTMLGAITLEHHRQIMPIELKPGHESSVIKLPTNPAQHQTENHVYRPLPHSKFNVCSNQNTCQASEIITSNGHGSGALTKVHRTQQAREVCLGSIHQSCHL